ncbi:hypothetical protein ABPG72_017126 [Tetrahymena utriculariae]
MNIEVNLIKHHQQMEEIERPETSKCSRQQNQLNKTLTNFRQKQGMGGGGGGGSANEQQLQSTNININSGQQQYQIQKNQPLPPSMINIPNVIISDRQQSRSGTRQGRNNNTSFQTTGQGFFKETFYRDTNINGNNNSSNNNNNSMVFNNSSSSNNNVTANNNKIYCNSNTIKNNATDTDEGITLDKYFGSNFQVINLGINNEEKPNKSTISAYVGHPQDQAQQNTKYNKMQSSFEESKQQSRQSRMSKEEAVNGGDSNQVKVKRPSKIQGQASFIEDNSGEYKDYMEEEFEIHETDEEYSESNRESQADLNFTDANYEDTIQRTNKSKRKSIEDRNRDKSQNNQDQSLTSKSIKQYLNTQESGDEKQIHIQKKLREKYSKKMRHKPFNSTTLQSHQNNNNNNNLDTSNQPSSTTSSNSQKNQSINQQIQQQSMNQQQQPYLLQYQSSNNSNMQPFHDNNNYQTYNSGKGKYSTNNTSQSYNTNYSTNFNSNVTVSGQNERGSLTQIDDQSQVNKTDFDSFNPKSGQNIQNSNNNNQFNSNNTSSQQQQAQKKYKSTNDDSTPQYKTYNYFAGNRKETGGASSGKEQNLNSSYLIQKQQQQQSFNHSTSLNQADNTISNDLQPQNSSQIDKTTKNYNIRKINKSQSPPVRDPFQPLITHQRNFSRDTTQLQNQQSFQLNNQYGHNNNSSSSMQNTINQASLASNTNSINTNNNNLAKSNAGNMINIQQNGVNNSQILNSQSGESFKQTNNIISVIQQNNSHIKVTNNTNNINQGMVNTGNINATIQNLQRKSKYGEFLDSQQNNNDKLSEMQKQFRTSFYHVKQQSMQHQNQQQNQNQANSDVNNFTQTSTSFANVIAAANGIQGFSNGQNPILAPLNSLPTNNSYYNATSKNRLTLNEFYKHQSKYEDYGQPSGPPNINQYEELIADNLMRRTAKENKFLNQKEKLNELIKQEDINFVTKYAARFNLNNDECQQLIQTGKQEKVQIKKRMETPHKGFRGEFHQAQHKKKLSVTKDPKQQPMNNNNNNPTLINRPQNDNNNQYQSKERNSVLF